MTPFGLKTTFIPPKVNNKTQLTHEEAQVDIDSMMLALEDAFPGLYDYTSKEEFNTYIKNKMAAIGPRQPYGHHLRTESDRWCKWIAFLGVFRLVQRHITGMAHCSKIQRLSRQTSGFGERHTC